MSRTCTICGHAERAAIDAAIANGGAYRDIARQHGVSKDALARHASAHVRPALALADADGARARDLLAEVDRLIRRIEGVLTRAERTHDDRLVLLATREVRGTLELLAKLRGDLDERPQVSITLAPEWVSVRTVILAALGPHNEARTAVAEALAQLAGDGGASSASGNERQAG